MRTKPHEHALDTDIGIALLTCCAMCGSEQVAAVVQFHSGRPALPVCGECIRRIPAMLEAREDSDRTCVGSPGACRCRH